MFKTTLLFKVSYATVPHLGERCKESRWDMRIVSSTVNSNTTQNIWNDNEHCKTVRNVILTKTVENKAFCHTYHLSTNKIRLLTVISNARWPKQNHQPCLGKLQPSLKGDVTPMAIKNKLIVQLPCKYCTGDRFIFI